MFALAAEGYLSLFEQLVAGVLSIRTRDEVSLVGARRLFSGGPTPAALARLSRATIIAPSPTSASMRRKRARGGRRRPPVRASAGEFRSGHQGELNRVAGAGAPLPSARPPSYLARHSDPHVTSPRGTMASPAAGRVDATGVLSGRRGGRASLPTQRTLLSWLFIGRLVLALATLVGASLVWTNRATVSFLSSIAVIFALTFTAYGGWAVFIRGTVPTHPFLQVQALVDLALVTALVHLAGQPQSAFPALYVLVVAAYAMLLPVGWGVVTALAASAMFLADVLWGIRIQPDTAFWAQFVVFNVVFLLVAVLSHRLREAGAEQASLEELERARLEADDILRNIRSGVLTVDALGRLAFINPTAQRLLHLDGESLIGEPVLDVLRQRSAELWAAIATGIRNGRKISRGEGMVVPGGGRQFPIGLSTTVFRQQAQEAPSVTAIFTDISDLKQLQELHLRAERLEAVAALSASLAHEIRNPLASIRSSVEQLARSRYASEDERFLAQLIVRESDRLTRLLNEFLDFSRVRATEFVPVDLREIAIAVARLVKEHPDCRPDTTITVEGQRTMLEGDADLLHRVVVNLVLNAVQAARGPMQVIVKVGPADGPDLPRGSDLEHAVSLEVRDDGPGIPQEVRERLFQPFVSGRPGGTGLGLPIVQRAVEAHRGLVLVDSRPDVGTVFTILLPAQWAAEEVA
jgi:two-component system sensor histidine kinase PilS (NtrC family)